MSFEDVLYNKDKEILECEEFINYIYCIFFDIYKKNINLDNLARLLYSKIDILDNLNSCKDDTFIEKLIQIDDDIYRQIECIKQDVRNDFKDLNAKNQEKLKLLKDKLEIKYNLKYFDDNIYLEYEFYQRHKENFKDFNFAKSYYDRLHYIKKEILTNCFFDKYIYKKSQKVKKEALLNIFKMIKNNQWISTVLFFGFGFIVYFLYFYKYTPFIPGQEFIYVITATSAIFLLIPVFILLFLWLLWLLYDLEKKGDKFKDGLLGGLFFYKSMFIFILSFILSMAFIILFKNEISNYASNLNITNFRNSILMLILIFLIFYLIICLAIKFQKFRFYLFIILLFIFSMYSFSNILKLEKLYFIIYIVSGISFFWIILVSKFTDIKFYASTLLLSVWLLILGSTGFFIDNVYKYLNFGNIDYEYIILDQNTKLPDEICDDTYIKNIKELKEMLSYKDETLTYKLENNTTKSLNIPFKCLAFMDKNGNMIKTYKKKNISHDNKINEKVFVAMPTYFIKNSDRIKLYNIKVLSTLGDKLYIEAKNGFRFKIDKINMKTDILD
ncbi:putative membrane protein [Campylobacter ureolyticus RIGS 9880]|uniref:Membrane protein n=1 Tax=Campylobacter ureolyticus RIGS 9880 TaxID=1032069 RepID=A0AAU8UC83_9BACT|nr:hypothetical protein [Campylobacter ureolyticus]AKT91352.1 putative membrane protein [Campylobacter ureolyticus RIGS 9880]